MFRRIGRGGTGPVMAGLGRLGDRREAAMVTRIDRDGTDPVVAGWLDRAMEGKR
jgi:hypothetical protein